MPKPPPAPNAKDRTPDAGESLNKETEGKTRATYDSAVEQTRARERVASPFAVESDLKPRARSSSPATIKRSSTPTVAERREVFEGLERQKASLLEEENNQLRLQNNEAKGLEAELQELRKEVGILRTQLTYTSETLRIKTESSRRLQGQLASVTSQAQREIEEYKNMLTHIQTQARLEKAASEEKIQALRSQLKRERAIGEALRSFTPSPASRHRESENETDTAVSPLPKRPAFDSSEPDGIPTWAAGLYLYESTKDQWHESMIKQLLLRFQIVQHVKDRDSPENALKLSLEAGRHAYVLNNMPLLAKCSYYRGCAEYALGRYQEACVSLEEARAAKGRYIEGDWSRKSLHYAKKKCQREDAKNSRKEPVDVQSYLDDAPIFKVGGTEMLIAARSRWFPDGGEEIPKRMAVTGVRVTKGRQASVDNRQRELSQFWRGSSDPSLPDRYDQLQDETDEVLLRQYDDSDQLDSQYYNAIIPTQKSRGRHERSSSSISSMSEMSSDAYASDASTCEVWRKPKKQQNTRLSTAILGEASDNNVPDEKNAPLTGSSTNDLTKSQVPSSSNASSTTDLPLRDLRGSRVTTDNKTSTKSHRKRPSQLSLSDSNSIIGISTKSQSKARTQESGSAEHYETSDADESEDAAEIFRFPARTSRTPRTARPIPSASALKRLTPGPKSAVPKLTASSGDEKVATPLTAVRQTTITTPDNPVFQKFAKSPIFSTTPRNIPPSILRAESDPIVPQDKGATDTAIATKDAQVPGLTKPRSSSLRDPSATPEVPAMLERKVSFAKSPTKRRKPSTKRASFPAPWTPPPPKSESRTTEELRPLVPPKDLASPMSTVSTPPETPRFVIARKSTGELGMKFDAGTPKTPRFGYTTLDLDSELSDMGESLDGNPVKGSPGFMGEPGEAEVDDSVVASSPIKDRGETAISTALESPRTLSSLKVRRPKKAPQGIDTVLANGGKASPEVRAKEQGNDVDENGKPVHIKFAGQDAPQKPMFERRPSSRTERDQPVTEVSHTPKDRPPTPHTSSSTYTSSPSSMATTPRTPHGPPLHSPHHVRAATVTNYSHVALARNSTFPTPLVRTLSSTSSPNHSPTGSPSPRPERGVKRTLKRASLASFPILPSSPSPSRSPSNGPLSPGLRSSSPGSPAVERARERRGKWAWSPKMVMGLMSPALGGFRRHGTICGEEEGVRDEEAGIGGGESDEDEERGKREGRFSDGDERVVKREELGAVDEEAGIGAGGVRSRHEGVVGRVERGGVLPLTETEGRMAEIYERGKMPGYFDAESDRSDGGV